MKNSQSTAKDDQKTRKTNRGVLLSTIATVTLIILAFIIYYLVVFPLSATRGDGVDKYKGAEKELAIKAISDLKAQIDDKKRWAYTFHVDEVRPTTAEEIIAYCTPANGEVTNNPDNPRFYIVIISTGETANPTKAKVIIDGCNAFGPKKDGAYLQR
jgi:hypothetical protein